MKVFKKIIGLIPALALSAMVTFGAGAQGVVDDVIDGAENIVDDTVDTAEDIVGGEDDTIGTSQDDSIVDNTGDDDIPDQLEDDAGMYLYALIADGQVIDTKRMILTK